MNQDAQRDLIRAGRTALIRKPMDALRAVLNPASLCVDANVRRATAYRVFKEPADDKEDRRAASDRLIARIAESTADVGWEGNQDVIKKVESVYLERRKAGDDSVSAIRAALAADFDALFEWPVVPITWMLTVAAFTASKAWRNDEVTIDDDQRALAELILDARRRDYQQIASQFMVLMRDGMSELRIRPRAGISEEQLLALLHGIFDGALMRTFIEPGLLDATLVADAVYALATALSEAGAVHVDVRRPPTTLESIYFDRMLAQAERTWRAGQDVELDSIARDCRPPIPVEEARKLFTSLAELADSLVRSMVISGDLSGHEAGAMEFSQLHGVLRRLMDASRDVPGAIGLLRSESSTKPEQGGWFVEDLTESIKSILTHRGAPSPNRTANQLVDHALRGDAGAWDTVETLLDIIGGDASDM
jgi:hypothetical protein